MYFIIPKRIPDSAFNGVDRYFLSHAIFFLPAWILPGVACRIPPCEDVRRKGAVPPRSAVPRQTDAALLPRGRAPKPPLPAPAVPVSRSKRALIAHPYRAGSESKRARSRFPKVVSAPVVPDPSRGRWSALAPPVAR